MHLNKYAIFETDSKLYFSRCRLYGYNKFNQSIYRLIFSADMTQIALFGSELVVNKILDSLPPTEHSMHICISEYGKQLKISNLKIVRVGVNYDS